MAKMSGVKAVGFISAAINSGLTRFDDLGGASDPAVVEQLHLIGHQVARFAPVVERGGQHQRTNESIDPA